MSLYLIMEFDLKGSTTAAGKLLATQKEVSDYLLSEASLAVVPFSAFGAGEGSPWYRISVGTCTLEEIEDMLATLHEALSGLRR